MKNTSSSCHRVPEFSSHLTAMVNSKAEDTSEFTRISPVFPFSHIARVYIIIIIIVALGYHVFGVADDCVRSFKSYNGVSIGKKKFAKNRENSHSYNSQPRRRCIQCAYIVVISSFPSRGISSLHVLVFQLHRFFRRFYRISHIIYRRRTNE